VTLSSEVSALATRIAQEFNSVKTQLAGKAALAHSHTTTPDPFGDLCSTCDRDLATGTQAMSATIRTHVLLLGRVPAGQAITGFRMARTVAAVGGVASAALFSSTTLTATLYGRSGTAVAPTLTGTGVISTPYAVAAQPNDLWWILQYVLTTAPTTYPTFVASPAVASQATGLRTISGSQHVAGYSSGTSAPGATLNPTTGWTVNANKPWAALY